MSTTATSSHGRGMSVPAASEESRDKYKDDMLSVGPPSLDAHAREAEQYLMEDSGLVPEAHRIALSTFKLQPKSAQIQSYRLRWGVAL